MVICSGQAAGEKSVWKKLVQIFAFIEEEFYFWLILDCQLNKNSFKIIILLMGWCNALLFGCRIFLSHQEVVMKFIWRLILFKSRHTRDPKCPSKSGANWEFTISEMVIANQIKFQDLFIYTLKNCVLNKSWGGICRR